MLKKRIKKYICVLSAVIIAFSSFSVSAKEPSFVLDNLWGYVYYEVYDENNNYLDTVYIYPDSLIVNVESDKIYLDISSTSPVFIKKGYFIRFYFSFEPLVLENSNFLEFYSVFILHSSERLSLLNSSCYYENLTTNKWVNKEFSIYKNSFYFLLSPHSNYYDCFLEFKSLVNSSNLSLVAEYSQEVSDIEKYISNSHSQPRKYKFFSDMGIFFKKAVSWVVDIFRGLATNPPTTVLVIGFVVVGFTFTLLGKIYLRR